MVNLVNSGNTAFIFPGQGSQYVGMGKSFYESSPLAKQIFEEADEALSFKLSKLMFEGPLEELSLTENTQPALLTVSIAALRILLHALAGANGAYKGLKNIVKYMAGHSLGEYSALCAAGALSLEETVKLVKFRGQAMQNAVPKGLGTMVALLKTNIAQVQPLIQGIENCQISNDNSEDQIVVSGENSAIEKFINIAKEAGLTRIIKLNVSAPFHSNLMQPAAAAMANYLENFSFAPLEAPIISNVTASAVTEASEMKPLLIEQMVKCVRWRETILFCENNGIENFIELGAGTVLSRLTSKTFKEANNYNLDNINDLDKIVKLLHN